MSNRSILRRASRDALSVTIAVGERRALLSSASYIPCSGRSPARALTYRAQSVERLWQLCAGNEFKSVRFHGGAHEDVIISALGRKRDLRWVHRHQSNANRQLTPGCFAGTRGHVRDSFRAGTLPPKLLHGAVWTMVLRRVRQPTRLICHVWAVPSSGPDDALRDQYWYAARPIQHYVHDHGASHVRFLAHQCEPSSRTNGGPQHHL